MNCKFETKIQQEIRKRAFERADNLQQERLNVQKTQHTLDALQEVTGLHRPELESIAAGVKHSYRMMRDDFFSLKNQMLITFGIIGFVLFLGGLMSII